MLKFKNDSVELEISVDDLVVVMNDAKATFKSKSELFKFLYESGLEINEISKLTGSHYSFVHGVIDRKCQRRKANKTSKSDLIRNLSDSGMTPGEIAKELNSNYSFVFSVVKKHVSNKKESKQAK